MTDLGSVEYDLDVPLLQWHDGSLDIVSVIYPGAIPAENFQTKQAQIGAVFNLGVVSRH
jgi:hypothetical protein